MCLVMWGIYCFYGIWMDISCLNYIYMCNSSFAIPYIPKYFFTLLKQCFPTGKQRNPVGKSGFRFLWFFWIFEFWNQKIRNFARIRFSDTTGNGKFSGKPDLPSEFFFLRAKMDRSAGREEDDAVESCMFHRAAARDVYVCTSAWAAASVRTRITCRPDVMDPNI